MMQDSETFLLVAVIGVTSALLFFIGKVFRQKLISNVNSSDNVKDGQTFHIDQQPASLSKRKLLAAAKKLKVPRNNQNKFCHPWLQTSLKAHTARVFDFAFSENGKLIASCGEDGTIHVWNTNNCFDKSTQQSRSIRCNMPSGSYAKIIRWSPDNKAFVVRMMNENRVVVYKYMSKKMEGGSHIQLGRTFNSIDDDDIIAIDVASTGLYIMAASKKTSLVIWDLKGQMLSMLDTYHMLNYCAKISPCGRFVVTSGFTPDAKVWQVVFGKGGSFVSVNRAFDLVGHTSGIYHFDINYDCSRIATVSKDGTWKLYNTQIEFSLGQDPSIVVQGYYQSDGDTNTKLSLSPDANIVAIGHDVSITLFSCSNGQALHSIDNLHLDSLTRIAFSPNGDYFLTAGDRHIRIFNNILGLRMVIDELKSKLKSLSPLASSCQRERLSTQIAQIEAKLKSRVEKS